VKLARDNMEGKKMSKEEEIKIKGGEFKRKRESLGKCLKMWKNEDTDGTDEEEVGDIKMSKDVELRQKAGEMELKRKIAGEWLAKCKENENQENNLGKRVDMWKKEDTDCTDEEEAGDIKISKDVELSQKAGEMEQKLKIAGEWLAKCKENENQENNISH
jgi:hypothetical protein